MSYKKMHCSVPNCKNSSWKCPEKIFINVPLTQPIRDKWLAAAGVSKDFSPKTVVYFCQDHFDVEADIENFQQYQFYKKAGLKTRIALKPGVIPHKFSCQEKEARGTSQLAEVERKKIVEELLQQCSSSSTDKDQVDAEDLNNPTSPPIIIHPIQPLSSSEPQKKNKNIQVRPYYRSIGIQKAPCEHSPIKRSRTSDAFSQVTPKKIKIDPPTSLFSSPSSSILSCGGSDWKISPSSSSHSDTSTINEEMKSLSLRVTQHNINLSPKYYIGMTPEAFNFLHHLADKCHCIKRNLLLVLKKIRRNHEFMSLGDDFGISAVQAGRIFAGLLPIMAAQLNSFIYAPPEKTIMKLLPLPFRLRYRKVRAIIDCFEVAIEKPTDAVHQSATWSEYKQCNTIKYLVSCTPFGHVNFLSKGYGGRTSDTALTTDSKFLQTLTPNTQIMADRGFKHLQPEALKVGVTLVRPPSVAAGEKLSKEVSKEAKRIASLRIHVERVIGRMRAFNFIGPEARIDNKLLSQLDNAVTVIGALVNLQDPLIVTV